MDTEEIERRISEMLAKRAARRQAMAQPATDDNMQASANLELFRHAAAAVAKLMGSVAESLIRGHIEARVVYYDGGERQESIRDADRVFLYVNVGGRGGPPPGGRPDYETWSELGLVCNPKDASVLLQVSFATSHLQYKGVAKRIALSELPVIAPDEIMAFVARLLEQD